MKAIETRYKGYRFRSRLEARWAVYLDKIGWEWEYEHQGYDLGNGLKYLPDFKVKASSSETNHGYFWLEIKASEPTLEEIEKARRLAVDTESSVLFGVGVPYPVLTSSELKAIQPDGTWPSDAGIGWYCLHKWHRPGWFMGGDYSEPEDYDACDAALGARFEFGESGMN